MTLLHEFKTEYLLIFLVNISEPSLQSCLYPIFISIFIHGRIKHRDFKTHKSSSTYTNPTLPKEEASPLPKPTPSLHSFKRNQYRTILLPKIKSLFKYHLHIKDPDNGASQTLQNTSTLIRQVLTSLIRSINPIAQFSKNKNHKDQGNTSSVNAIDTVCVYVKTYPSEMQHDATTPWTYIKHQQQFHTVLSCRLEPCPRSWD